MLSVDLMPFELGDVSTSLAPSTVTRSAAALQWLDDLPPQTPVVVVQEGFAAEIAVSFDMISCTLDDQS